MKIGPAMMVVGGGAAVAGSFLAWITVKAMGQEQTIAGFQGDGKITVAAAGIAVVLGLIALAGKGVPKASLMIVGVLAGLAAAGVAGYDYMQMRKAADTVEKLGGSYTPGIGIYLVMAGGAIAALGALIRPKATA